MCEVAGTGISLEGGGKGDRAPCSSANTSRQNSPTATISTGIPQGRSEYTKSWPRAMVMTRWVDQRSLVLAWSPLHRCLPDRNQVHMSQPTNNTVPGIPWETRTVQNWPCVPAEGDPGMS